MNRILGVLLVATMIFMAGCSGKKDEATTTTPGSTTTSDGTTTTTGAPPNLMVTINAPAAANASQPFTVAWTVTGTANGSTSLRFGPSAVTITNSSQASAYPEGTALQTGVTFPGTFSAQLNLSAAVYVRALVTVGSTNFWSSEAFVNVTAPGTIHTVRFVPNTAGLGGPTATANPVTVNIAKGDGVQWRNADTAANGAPHSAASTATPSKFNTGSIAVGATSGVVYFTEAGTYDYRCGLHTNTMTGYKVVVAA